MCKTLSELNSTAIPNLRRGRTTNETFTNSNRGVATGLQEAYLRLDKDFISWGLSDESKLPDV